MNNQIEKLMGNNMETGGVRQYVGLIVMGISLLVVSRAWRNAKKPLYRVDGLRFGLQGLGFKMETWVPILAPV